MVVADYFEFEEAIFFDLAKAYVVNYEVAFLVAGFSFGDDSDMGGAAAQIPAYDVTWEVVCGGLGEGFCCAFAGKEGH